MTSKLIAYGMDFASFAIQKVKEREKIKNIILFGSVAREEADSKSDVDIFVDVTGEKIKLENELKKCLADFNSSTKYKNYWGALGIRNEVKITVGELDKWKELKPSIASNGILLYGKFKPDISEGVHKAFFIWENVRPNSRRVLLNKQLFGYAYRGKSYPGLVEKYKGEHLGKGCIGVPAEHATLFHKLFKKYNAAVKIKKVVEY